MGDRFAILKWINYKDGGLSNARKKCKYISRRSSSPIEFQKGVGVSSADPCTGLEVIRKRWNPRGEREFKHGIFSFGTPDIAPKKAFEVSV